MRDQVECDLVVIDQDVGMMVGSLRRFGDRIHKPHCSNKIGKLQYPPDRDLMARPTGQLSQGDVNFGRAKHSTHGRLSSLKLVASVCRGMAMRSSAWPGGAHRRSGGPLVSISSRSFCQRGSGIGKKGSTPRGTNRRPEYFLFS